MKYAAVLLVGILVGFYLGRLPSEKPVSSEKPITVLEDYVPRPLMESKTARITTIPTHNSEVSPNQQKQGREMTLNNFMIEEMEKNWSHLREQIQIKRESDGWRVIEIDEKSPFFVAGFSKGDLITPKALETLHKEGPAAGDLPARFAYILNYVTTK